LTCESWVRRGNFS